MGRGSETQLQLGENLNSIRALTLQRGDRLWESESDVCRRHILTCKVDPRAVRVKIFVLSVYPQHRYSNESETKTFMMISI